MYKIYLLTKMPQNGFSRPSKKVKWRSSLQIIYQKSEICILCLNLTVELLNPHEQCLKGTANYCIKFERSPEVRFLQFKQWLSLVCG